MEFIVYYTAVKLMSPFIDWSLLFSLSSLHISEVRACLTLMCFFCMLRVRDANPNTCNTLYF